MLHVLYHKPWILIKLMYGCWCDCSCASVMVVVDFDIVVGGACADVGV